MQAIVVEHLGETGTLREIPLPQPGTDEILVRITAAGVNPIDWKSRDGGRKPLPFVLGQDFAGVVSAVGNNVNGYKQGERIFGIARKHGAYAQFTLVPQNSHAEPIAHIPRDVGDADAAALPTAGLTALAALNLMALGQGQTLVILGVTGGVGSFAAQIAKSRGARVIGTGHSGHERSARDIGIDEYIPYDTQSVADAIKAKVPSGADAVLDLVNDREGTAVMKPILRPGKWIVSTIGGVDVERFERDGFKAANIVMSETPESSHDGLRQLARMVEDGTLRVIIAAERDLRDATQALEESKSGRITGKLVLTVESGRI
jgi:NADPH:quinone reductase-like Zn-dependent oxidoreductase